MRVSPSNGATRTTTHLFEARLSSVSVTVNRVQAVKSQADEIFGGGNAVENHGFVTGQGIRKSTIALSPA